MPNFTYATLNDAISALSARLYDPAMQQWTQPELASYVTEALRTWNALSGFHRAEMVFPLQPDWWHDLHTQPGTVVPYTVTKYDLIRQVQNHLLEPPTPAAWSGSGQFTLQSVLNALQRRQDDTLGTTACTLARSTPNAALVTRTLLPDNVIDIRRVAWLPVAGMGYQNKILRQSDQWAERAFNPRFTTTAAQPPSTWMQNAEGPPSFDVDTMPPVPGRYDVLSVDSGPQWNPGEDSRLNIPDDWTWVMKWGALADLLAHESNAKDSLRADYCLRRYREGLALLESAPTVLGARLDNIPLGVDSIRNGDDFDPSWQHPGITWADAGGSWEDADYSWDSSPGPPRFAYVAANIMAFSPAATTNDLTWNDITQPWEDVTFTWGEGSTHYSATIFIVKNAPVPTGTGSYIQVARDDFDAIIDYAQHLAMFKAGGAEFLATVPLYQSFQKKAMQYNGKLKEQGIFSMPQLDLGQLQEMRSPRYLAGTGPDA